MSNKNRKALFDEAVQKLSDLCALHTNYKKPHCVTQEVRDKIEDLEMDLNTDDGFSEWSEQRDGRWELWGMTWMGLIGSIGPIHEDIKVVKEFKYWISQAMMNSGQSSVRILYRAH